MEGGGIYQLLPADVHQCPRKSAPTIMKGHLNWLPRELRCSLKHVYSVKASNTMSSFHVKIMMKVVYIKDKTSC